MTSPSRLFRPDRRAFLVASTVGFAGLQIRRDRSSPRRTKRRPHDAAKAKSTILFFLCGGSSHIDMWDLKPDAPAEYRGPFKPIATSAPGVQISEHLPLTAKQAHHFSIVRSVSGHGEHERSPRRLLLQPHRPRGRPDVSSRSATIARRCPTTGRTWATVVGSRVPSRGGLPSAVTLPYMPSRLPYTRPGQFAARLGVEHDPLYVLGSHEKPLQFEAPALALSGDVDGGAALVARSTAVDAERRPTPRRRRCRRAKVDATCKTGRCRCSARPKRRRRSTSPPNRSRSARSTARPSTA